MNLFSFLATVEANCGGGCCCCTWRCAQLLHPSAPPASSPPPLLINNFNCIHSRAAPLYYSNARKMCQQNIFANIFCTQETCSPIVETPSPPSPLCPALSALPCTDDVARCGFVFRFQFALQCVCVCVPWLGQTLALITRQQQRLTSICASPHLLLSPTYTPLSPLPPPLDSLSTSLSHRTRLELTRPLYAFHLDMKWAHIAHTPCVPFSFWRLRHVSALCTLCLAPHLVVQWNVQIVGKKTTNNSWICLRCCN